jgi:hypothetical protein
MTSAPPSVLTEAAARKIMSSGLGRAELEFVMSLTAPLFWIIREGEKQYRVRNGSAFFLDAGQGPFGVTARHVLAGLKADRDASNVVAVQIGNLPLDLAGRNSVIASHEQIDIATFRITTSDIQALGKTVLTGYQRRWPPAPPQRDRGVYFGGFPGRETTWMSPKEVSFGAAPAGGVASSISEIDVSTLIERENLITVLGAGLPPQNYDFAGMSGGPMLAVIEQGALRSWSLAGVIYQGPNPCADAGEAIEGLEIIKARRSRFVIADGTLDIRLWEDLSPRPLAVSSPYSIPCLARPAEGPGLS